MMGTARLKKNGYARLNAAAPTLQYKREIKKAREIEAPSPVPREEIDWEPRPNSAQEAVLESEADEVLMGGPAGIGKSDALLGLAFKHQTSTIIYRTEYPQLKALINRGNQILGSPKFYNKTSKTWDLKDRQVELGAAKRDDDWIKFQGRPHDGVFFDELTHFSRHLYLHLTGWTRTTKPGQRCRVVCTSNPPTSSQGRWVISHWAPWLDKGYKRRTGREPAMPGEIRWFVTPRDGEEIEVDSGEKFEYEYPDGEKEMLEPRSRTYVTGIMLPELQDTGYRRVLQSLDEPLRSILLEGIWDAKLPDHPFQVIPTEWIDLAMSRWNDYPSELRQTHLGVDVARGGADQTVICSRWGHWVDRLKVYPGKSTPDGKATMLEIRKEIQNAGVQVNVDVIGVGASAYDFCIDSGIDARPCVGSGAAKLKRGAAADEPLTDKAGVMTFANLRSYNYWRLRELLDPKQKSPISLPPDDDLKEELQTVRYRELGRNIAVMSKDDIIKLLGRSPDRADAVVYSFWEGGDATADWMLDLVSSDS